MKIEMGKLEGDLVVGENEELEIRGMVTGHVRLSPRATLVLRGLIGGTLVVGTDATAKVFGTVGHSVFNAGGTGHHWPERRH